MESSGKVGSRVVGNEEPMFDDICELLELDPDTVEYLVIEDFEDVDYMMFEEFDDMEVEEAWKPEQRIIEIFFADGIRDEIEIELDSETDEMLKRMLG
ncbi:MAG: hypothetical protein GQ561_06835 [Calditrichae bacterium]|nr:hypothetical protein [Calditrichia bacterium]